MLNPAEQEQVRVVIKTHWSIYLAFTMAIVMYTVVVYIVTSGRTPEPREIGALRQLFVALSVVAGAIKFWVQSRFLSSAASYQACRSLDEIVQRYWRYNFIMLALCEIPALLGLIIVFITMRLQEWWLFFGISALLFITSAPISSRLERIVEAHAARWPAGS